MKCYDYCSKCRKRREHLKIDNEMLCKTCGKISKTFNPKILLIGKK